MKTITCVILSTQKARTYEALHSVLLPALSGQMQILPRHAEVFVLLGPGTIVLESLDGTRESIPVENGESYIRNDMVKIFL
ncbi:MAG: hypothetical protein COZ49_00040 [Candidatus Yonathbacteria bacterium CG_4_10_14_3_um_filter_47_65]|uniref:ATP synthase F1 complex delta/epsilon subunit N-terminal domain-containing protein n=2 Tax=Parcubacteria group TaxID=1794811 RepID=A0A2M8D8R9_9BACT|nr:MAG: hypothetical protein AUJ44_00180 [Candidatus Nomurabacteria bacterium CG1_02_47_685]PIP04198.1 MAG: hypothetical protein COX54_00345 [Candidatus Yonathbacteria bacterium CG23_combo_of_CG06-09_8_20_14_all_46_18]PIQ32394.1 MAG: hypothetical protein COW61_01770 [Candidatus Yonathbacteria bacterium CG17_big_fil_post_rev_8_21_14_2_50_46_19]PIX56818.1 MAG: hypothetical protein COZ49_00040 [Candidatus Yonathbacteria bacterium CG_4_10_14_3_um_filter_47_65]PIY57848.1 MAG: hypothetical protein CO